MGGGNPASSEVKTDLPDWAKPYYERALGRVEASSLTPYQQYSGDRLANAADYGNITKAQGIVSNLGGVQGLGAAQDYSQYAMDQSKALGNYTPTQTTASQFSPYAGYQAGSAAPYSGFQAGAADPYSGFKAGTANPYSDFKATEYSQAKFDPYSDFKSGTADPYSNFKESQFNEYNYDPSRQFSGQEVQNYMNPYMQNVVNQQSNSAITNFNRQNASRAAQGVQAGAFGGSRQGVVQGMAEEGLMGQLDQIQGKGLSDAYGQAQGAFQADRSAQVANEQARAAEASRVQAAGGSEAARVQQAQAAEMARTQGIGIDEASRIQQAQAGELARTQGISLDEASRIQAGQAGEQSRVQAANAAEMARVQQQNEAANQFGAGQGIAALGAGAAGAQALAGYGQLGREADIQNAQLLETVGRSQQQEGQQGLDIQYQDYLTKQGFTQNQIGQLSNMLQGLPIQNSGVTNTVGTPATPGFGQQMLGAGLGGLSLYRAFNPTGNLL